MWDWKSPPTTSGFSTWTSGFVHWVGPKRTVSQWNHQKVRIFTAYRPEVDSFLDKSFIPLIPQQYVSATIFHLFKNTLHFVPPMKQVSSCYINSNTLTWPLSLFFFFLTLEISKDEKCSSSTTNTLLLISSTRKQNWPWIAQWIIKRKGDAKPLSAWACQIGEVACYKLPRNVSRKCVARKAWKMLKGNRGVK